MTSFHPEICADFWDGVGILELSWKHFKGRVKYSVPLWHLRKL